MLSVEIPTGYAYEQFDGLKLIRTGIVPELKEVDATQNGQTIWYFNHIPKDVRCFEHTVKIVETSFLTSLIYRNNEILNTLVNGNFSLQVRRYFPVANLTRTRQAVIMEPLNPERFFVRTFNATSLYILSICEVCGSYQCPFCPSYSRSTSIKGKS